METQVIQSGSAKKPGSSKELKFIGMVVLSSIVLAGIFAAVWVIRKIREGVL